MQTNNDQIKSPKSQRTPSPPERRLRVYGKIPTRQCGLLLFSLYPRIRLSQGIDLADLLFPVLRTTELTVLDLLIELHTGVQHLTKDQPFEILEIKPNSEFGIESHSAIIGQLISLCNLQSRQPLQIQINPSRMQLQRRLH